MTAMTLKDFICARSNEDEFTVFDKDYDVEVYFYHFDQNDKWSAFIKINKQIMGQ